MRLRTRDGVGLALGLLGLAGCRDDPSFITLLQLCKARAIDVCDARARCCTPEDEAACLARETSVCEQTQQQLEAEPLSYDAAQATRTREAQQAELAACQVVPALAGFYSGGLALGASCERAAQCASGSCAGAPPACVAATATPLCSAP